MVFQNAYRPAKGESSRNDGDAWSKEDSSEVRIRAALENDRIDSKYGFDRIRDHQERTGYLINMHTTEILDEDKKLVAAMDYYFIEMDGSRFKISLAFQPYFLIQARKNCQQEVIQFLSKKYAGVIAKIESVEKEDLDLANHLSGLRQTYIKLSFVSQSNLMKVRKELLTAANKNREKEKKDTIYAELLANTLTSAAALEHAKKTTDHMENILDIREHDVPYHVRVSIDMEIFCGLWYTIKSRGSPADTPKLTKRDDILERPDPIVLAYDIETTKLPLKFPDSQTDQIMMISYMIDGQGYLITNREIISSDVEDFEYTPKPEFEGMFIIFNEPNELALLQKFFDHILDVKPHIFVTYNGDFFDWPFVEARSTANGLDMKQEIGFSKSNSREGAYFCRPAMHMDCLCWVKRDSYLPVGSQGLKAVAKAKLRYDPVELDPEDMCRMAMEQPQVLSNYSVSDAVATYYLYMKYVHPFIFALCTIIPMEPDEVLRKGSGTLCETLLMVQAFHANIVFPNKQIEQLNKLTTDGHVLDQETYVGGHVEALESGVFRADIPCRFRLIPQAFDQLSAIIEQTMKHAIEVEEGVPMDLVTNFDEVCDDIRGKLHALRDQPNRLENPVIYHLDVGAMYPNIILTNRLQPSAMVNSSVCAVCDLNRPGATCQRHMDWTWRGEFLPATRSEYQRIQQQLECEKFPPLFPGGPQRAFHTLSKEDRAAYEKKRLSDYCRVAYKKTKVTRIETRTTTVCQKENSFYVDTVRAFRDRRYEYKALNKKAKQLVNDAVKSGDAAEVKAAKSREVLYDSLQLAHKCILNSFYGYVMRRGARWHSMEMAGIVCYTGANIIMKAREIIEQVGRPLELDTDGIWCVLPASFPETFTVLSSHEKKKKFNVSYPNAVLNSMVKDFFTNEQYHELTDAESREYTQRCENSIFFEVDGPYLGMVLPASKEEGKKLKKRYAVFNFDGTLAELKGFEVKRRGELQLIKIFQSSVFESFLKGDTLETCYAAVAKVADYWLDVLYSKGSNMPDTELFELISENRSMSKKLEDYGGQKSTSISTAKRLAEFLGDKMVKDAGLACKFIISKKPEGAPVTERAIPLAIFQSSAAVKRHHLRRWLKDNSIDENIDIRDVLDWAYYIERLSGTIQKIITIPAAMQGLANPVPRVKHPEWLHKKMLEKNDTLKQRRISEMFTSKPRAETIAQDRDEEDSEGEGVETHRGAAEPETPDMEDIGRPSTSKTSVMLRPMATKMKRKRQDSESEREHLKLHWKEALGPAPPRGKNKEETIQWILFQKKKWEFQRAQRKQMNTWKRNKTGDARVDFPVAPARSSGPVNSLGSFLRRTQRTLLDSPWQIVQVSKMSDPGLFKLWVLIGAELHQVKLTVPRIFYVNQRIPKTEEQGASWKKCNRILPRGRPIQNLYQYSVPEKLYKEHQEILMGELSAPEIEGIYETQLSLEFRVLIQLGCVCMIDRQEYKSLASGGNMESFNLHQLHSVKLSDQPYLENVNGSPALKRIFLYQHNAANSTRGMYALFLGPSKQAHVYVLDTVRTDQMPNMNSLFAAEWQMKTESAEEQILPPKGINFTVHIEKEAKTVYRLIQLAIREYREENRGPTILALQVTTPVTTLFTNMPSLLDFPTLKIHVQDVESLYNTLDWQRVGSRAIVRHYLDLETNIDVMLEQCRYLRLPLCNAPSDPGLFGTDLCYARYLIRNNFVLWCSDLERPDLGGRETDDNRLISDAEDAVSTIHNSPGAYATTCVELHTDALAVCALLQSQNILHAEGTSAATYFGAGQVPKIIDAVSGANKVPQIDEGSASSAALRVLKGLLTTWLKDLLKEKNLYANFQMTHFYRWLKTPTSLMYDPALTRTLQSLMKKLFLQLVAEFKRLGSSIVFANFSKIILNTKKNSIMDAIGYVEFVVQSIRNKELFHGIDLSYKHCWSYLMWLDEANHAGIVGRLPKGLLEAGESQDSQLEFEEQSSEDADIQMKWNMAEYLPEGVRNYFSAVVAGYIGTAYTERDKLADMLQGEMLQKLFSITEKIQMRYPQATSNENLLGELPGIRLDEDVDQDLTPALQFINAICKVLNLDATVVDQMIMVRRSLLRLVGVGEFNPIAQWKDPCSSFILSEIICRICNHCKDLDLCRDKDVSMGQDGIPVCMCECGAAYNNSEIEWRLVEALNKSTLAYNLQDLICVRCREVKRENMAAVCTCAGGFKLMLPRNNVVSRLRTFRAIAKYFKMDLLLQLVEFNLQAG